MTTALRRTPLYVMASCYVVFVLAPIVYMFLVAMQPTATAGTELVPRVWHWQTFQEIWLAVDLTTYLRNSIIISVATGIFSTVLALGAGYVVARYRFRLRTAFRISLLASHSVPGILLLLPLYVIYVIVQHLIGLQLVGTYSGVILTYLTFGLPFSIWMLSVYVIELPVDLEEQAMVDGANRLGVLRWVTVPLAIPGMVVSFVFTFLLAWNDVLFAGALTSPATRTLGVGLQSFLSENYSLPQWNQLMGASIVSAVPAVILFLFVQRHMVTGLSAGSVKG